MQKHCTYLFTLSHLKICNHIAPDLNILRRYILVGLYFVQNIQIQKRDHPTTNKFPVSLLTKEMCNAKTAVNQFQNERYYCIRTFA